MSPSSYIDASMLELFQMEARAQADVLSAGLIALERDPLAADHLEACMRAAHSLKGAARIVDLKVAVPVAHVMEDAFVAAQEGRLLLTPVHIDALLAGVDLLLRIGASDPAAEQPDPSPADVDGYVVRLTTLLGDATTLVPAPLATYTGPPSTSTTQGDVASRANADWIGGQSAAPVVDQGRYPGASMPVSGESPEIVRFDRYAASASEAASASAPAQASVPAFSPTAVAPATEVSLGWGESAVDRRAVTAADVSDVDTSGERVLRVTAGTLNRLLGLSSEALVETQWLTPFANNMLRLKRQHGQVDHLLDTLHLALGERAADPVVATALAEVRRVTADTQQALTQRLTDIDEFSWRIGNLSQRLYDTALASRMRPLADGVGGLARMVRDLGRELGKPVRLDIVGERTPVDRDILEKLDAPFAHLLRNAIDHGIESPQDRHAAGKPAEGVLTLAARHSAGMLIIEIGDDGAGIDVEGLRTAVVERQLSTAETAARMSESELLAFLFLPGFSTKKSVTQISGRGVGLDAVHETMRQLRGVVRVEQGRGQGTRFTLEMPLSLSVVRSLLVEIGDEAYALPLGFVNHTLRVPRAEIEQLEGHQHFRFFDRHIGLVSARQLLQYAPNRDIDGDIAVVVIGDAERLYGVAVDRFLGERTLVVQPLDARLGKLQDVTAGALLDDGTPALILDIEDMLRSIEKLVSDGRLSQIAAHAQDESGKRRKRVLVVDDSLTVRELERKLLSNRGYDVAVAVDGIDGWNQLRAESFDLVVSDVDMPRMDGIELVTMIKNDPRLHNLPVMIVSYKDREEDRQRGLNAGADYYLAKGSFHDETLLDAVEDLIGGASA
ncbi:hybrid sensor histidine kinase/response regulator [Alcaligenaceae bacterium B3P038]|nr:hybrid sensor histidine kinase/response regulator [Alcaligenaceae bacterium B3P038]